MIAKTDLTRTSESDHKLSMATATADVTVKQKPREIALLDDLDRESQVGPESVEEITSATEIEDNLSIRKSKRICN